MDKRGWTAKKGHHFAQTAMAKKVVIFFQEKNRGDINRQLPPRVTPALVTPLIPCMRCCNRKRFYRQSCILLFVPLKSQLLNDLKNNREVIWEVAVSMERGWQTSCAPTSICLYCIRCAIISAQCNSRKAGVSWSRGLIALRRAGLFATALVTTPATSENSVAVV